MISPTAPSVPLESTADLARRFSGVGRLYGDTALARFRASHVIIAGVGGVGSWVAEALARSAVGRFTLIDLDMVAESNVNRQIQALGDEFGRAKIAVLGERLRAINPSVELSLIEDFVAPDNVSTLLPPAQVLIDAVDDTRAKVAMIAYACASQLPVVTAGAAGGRLDPTAVRRDDLAWTTQDPLLARVRAQLRKFHGFPRDPRQRFGITAIFSAEPMRRDTTCAPSSGGLNCSGYGSSVCVTAAFGLAAAAATLAQLQATG